MKKEKKEKKVVKPSSPKSEKKKSESTDGSQKVLKTMIPKDDLEAQTVNIAILGDIKVTKSKDAMISEAEAEMLAKKKKKSKKEKEKKLKKASLAVRFMTALTDIMASPISKYTTIGASFRYFGQFASDYYLPLFYLSNYTT